MSALLEPRRVLPSTSVVGGHFRLGVSTGSYAEARGDWDELVRRSWAASDAAVELAALSEPELPALVEFLEDASLPFRFVSVHAPTKLRAAGDAALAAQLADLPGTVDAIVLHPDTLDDLPCFRVLGARAVIENMDARKASGTTVAELAEIFEVLPEARFCLDVAHVWSIDPTMALAHELLDAFAMRLSHLHVSGLTEQCRHVALTPELERAFAPVLARCIDVPWILEAV